MGFFSKQAFLSSDVESLWRFLFGIAGFSARDENSNHPDEGESSLPGRYFEQGLLLLKKLYETRILRCPPCFTWISSGLSQARIASLLATPQPSIWPFPPSISSSRGSFSANCWLARCRLPPLGRSISYSSPPRWATIAYVSGRHVGEKAPGPVLNSLFILSILFRDSLPPAFS